MKYEIDIHRIEALMNVLIERREHDDIIKLLEDVIEWRKNGCRGNKYNAYNIMNICKKMEKRYY